MNKKYNITKKLPFLPHLLRSLVPKLLDFSEFPYFKGQINKVNKLYETYAYYSMDKNKVNLYHQDILTMLLPKNDSLIRCQRLGPNSDGGYLLPELTDIDSHWLTIGLGANVSFENDLAKKDFIVHSFDHTIDSRPKYLDGRVIWKKYGYSINVTSITGPITKLLHIADFPRGVRWNLKLDIEGSEWDLFKEIPIMQNPPIILVTEIHNVLYNPDTFFKKLEILRILLANYEVISAHGNNYSTYFITEDYGIYDALEITFLHKSKFTEYSNKSNREEIDVHFPNDPKSFNPPLFLKGD